MARVFLGVGSNIRPAHNVRLALELLARQARLAAVSTFFETRPDGGARQPLFYNGAVEIATELEPAELKRTVLRPLEARLGRRRSGAAWGARTIDLDLLIHGELVVRRGRLCLPAPGIEARAYQAVPLAELAPALVLPGTARTLGEIAARHAGHAMRPLAGYTAELRALVLAGPAAGTPAGGSEPPTGCDSLTPSSGGGT